jgi:uncharacterized glyoxalase superfamily protein PhnB
MEFVGICLITDNVLDLADFYSKVLGVNAGGDDVHIELQTEGANITIFSAKGMEKMAPGCMQGAGNGSFTIGFEVNDLDIEYERLKSLGVEFVMLPTTHPWGTKSIWFRDPDGNIINFFTVLTS